MRNTIQLANGQIAERIVPPKPPTASGKPKLLDQLRRALRSRQYSRRTEQAYCRWVKRFIFFHRVRHPKETGEPEINAFLTHLAVERKVSASTQNQALTDQDPEWPAFTTAFGALFGDGFEIQSETGRVLFDLLMPEQPITIKFQRDGIVLNVKNAGIRFDELKGDVTFVCGKNKLLFVDQASIDEEEPRRVEPMRFGPTRIKLRSRDPRVTWDQEITCNWRADVTGKIYAVETDTTAEIGQWRSENHAIKAILSGIDPD